MDSTVCCSAEVTKVCRPAKRGDLGGRAGAEVDVGHRQLREFREGDGERSEAPRDRAFA